MIIMACKKCIQNLKLLVTFKTDPLITARILIVFNMLPLKSSLDSSNIRFVIEYI